ncbi:aminodeoxychorismate lyase [Raineyella sp. LH-20]|uniref:aminodeoxychorismate lyase n=1 Tax=Raineyella sp. LH-20 TaxID=3081204 RepID=UPI0029544315|nr:aminodeoxychorismate lyase [Raineyella sp. LH-20]WOP19157.1 aminodeoxychorismate lyase [Raineyella sp. LH-20]
MTSPVLFFVDDLAEGTLAPGQSFHRADPDAPQLRVTDLAVTRGDGIFETAGVLHGHVQALDPHLRRFARSARLLDLLAPRLDVWRAAILAAVAAYGSEGRAYAKFVMTRGVEGTDLPTGWVYVAEREDVTAAQRDGIRVVTLDRGYRHDVAQTSPWLLQGAKTLSYAVNKAALREAARRGADDVLFTSSDGYALEGPTSTLLARFGDTYATPDTDLGILAGTTQARAFRHLERAGHVCEYRRISTAELPAADALWLLSSTRLAVPVRALDGRPVSVDAKATTHLLVALESTED